MIETRFYKPSDRDGIRKICVETAFYGEPLQKWIDLDPRIFADIFISYNTDYEPESLIVALNKGEPVGYMALSLDTAKQKRCFFARILPGVLYKALTGEYRLGYRIFVVLLRYLSDLCRYGFVDIPEKEYPVEIHLNYLKGFRGNRDVWQGLVSKGYRYIIENGYYKVRGLNLQKRRRGFVDKISNLGFKVYDSVTTTI
jgi:hypothetical protein